MTEEKQTYKEEVCSIQYLRERGLLAEINRKILHPLGLALGVYLDEDTEKITGTFVKQSDDPEGYYFSNATLERNKNLHKKYCESRKFIATHRKKKFGESIQTKEWSNEP